jgi:REP element-mobilizing transposase RayT
MPETMKLTYIRHLPHIQSSLRPLFMTWRLKFTLPDYIKHQLLIRKQAFEAKIASLSPDYQALQQYSFEKQRFAWFDSQLPLFKGTPAFLTQDNIAPLVIDPLLFHTGSRYTLSAYCLMPNHVHVIIQQERGTADNPFPLSKITQSWKRHSSTKIKKTLGIADSVWQAESYDHVIRNEQELMHYLEYVMENPVQAGLVEKWDDWKWSWVNPVFLCRVK